MSCAMPTPFLLLPSSAIPDEDMEAGILVSLSQWLVRSPGKFVGPVIPMKATRIALHFSAVKK